ncbi:MFS transporter [Corynebacterium pseudopelargi]|uniref:MFS transporter n=1 Tax=Corynebacterium pseudopelargi TaxID=2080757 RepID=UPI000F4F6BB1
MNVIWKGLSTQAKLLLWTQFAFNVGFYLVVPFLAIYMADTLGIAGATIGVILGLRTFSQQGLFVLGGILSDRFGLKPVLLSGIAIRVLGFLIAAKAQSVMGLGLGVVLIGVAAALFSPAVEARLGGLTAKERGGKSTQDVFAANATFLHAGSLIGPAFGALLIPLGFEVVCLVAAGIFVLLFFCHLRWTTQPKPQLAPETIVDTSSLSGLGTALRHRAFMVFALLVCATQVSYHLQYIALPAWLQHADLNQSLVGWLFAGVSIYVVAGQMRFSAWSESRGAALMLPLAMLIQACAWAAMAVFALAGAHSIWPLVAFLVVLHAGQMLIAPMVRSIVVMLAPTRLLGTYYGLLNTLGGIAVLASTSFYGKLIDVSFPSAWLFAAILLGLSAFGLWYFRGVYLQEAEQQNPEHS